ncbi:hypothetical protein LAZ67_5002982 [Cordylochernes scorpioides]|uniref:Uncharacterized protein n=1 Tax=Cordylochernes scorpioides TaxID=51811 RepID=A0ABY6KKE1_9ARAC|nr:hypothetical protein LAZ67_5002982 [Cordylochernes scorpioides]
MNFLCFDQLKKNRNVVLKAEFLSLQGLLDFACLIYIAMNGLQSDLESLPLDWPQISATSLIQK